MTYIFNIGLCPLFRCRGESLHKKERELQLAQARLSESSGTTESSLSAQLQLKVDSLEAENVRLRELDGPRAGDPAVYNKFTAIVSSSSSHRLSMRLTLFTLCS